MAFIGKNPKFDSTILKDIGSDTPENPAASSGKLVNRNGSLFMRDSGGTEVEIGELPIDLTSDVTGALPAGNGGTGTATSTGTGDNVLSDSPVLVTPALGTPSSATLTNATGLPIDAGTTGTLPAARGGTATTTSTGTGDNVLSNSPTLVTPALGTPASGTLTNTTGLPIDAGTTGTLPVARGGTGQATATAAFDGLAPTTTKGDLVASDGTNNVRQAVGADGLILKADSTTSTGLSWGSAAAGTGEVNYIENPDAEANTTGWATYLNTAQATPVTGTGGSANITWTRQSGTVLRGNQSFQLTKDAADRQGEGVSYDFTIKEQDVSKKLKIQFDFKTNEDAAYVADDFAVYIYDVTNATLITPVDTGIISGQNIFQTSFNSTTSTSYRLIFHCATTNASAYDLYFDNVIVGPGMTSQGAAIGAWEEFTPASTWTANITFTGYKRRVGENLEVMVGWDLTGAPTATDFKITIPDGLSLNTSVLHSTADEINNTTFGRGYFFDGALSYQLYAAYEDANTIAVRYGGTSTNELVAFNYVSLNNPVTWATGDRGQLTYSIPITEWQGKGIVPMLAEDNLSEWQAFTPVLSAGIFTFTDLGSYQRRVGDTMEATFKVQATSTGASGAVDFEIPGGLTPNADLVNTSVAVDLGDGHGLWHDDSASLNKALVPKIETNAIRLNQATNTTSLSIDGPNVGSGDKISFKVSIPILEWAGSQNSLVGYSLATQDNAGLMPAYSSGTYTPTLTVGTNCSALGGISNSARYMQVGNQVWVAGQFSATITSTGTNTFWYVSVPIESAMTDEWDLSGSGVFEGLIKHPGTAIRFNAVQPNAALFATSLDSGGSVGNRRVTYSFMYILK